MCRSHRWCHLLVRGLSFAHYAYWVATQIVRRLHRWFHILIVHFCFGYCWSTLGCLLIEMASSPQSCLSAELRTLSVVLYPLELFVILNGVVAYLLLFRLDSLIVLCNHPTYLPSCRWLHLLIGCMRFGNA